MLVEVIECVELQMDTKERTNIIFSVSSPGPYFPRRGQKPIGPKSNIRPPRPQFNMMLHSSQIEATKVNKLHVNPPQLFQEGMVSLTMLTHLKNYRSTCNMIFQ